MVEIPTEQDIKVFLKVFNDLSELESLNIPEVIRVISWLKKHGLSTPAARCTCDRCMGWERDGLYWEEDHDYEE